MKFDLIELLKSFDNIGSLYAVVKDLYSGKFFPLPSVVVAAVDAGLLRNVDGGVTPATKSIYTMSFFLTDDGRRKCGLPVFVPEPPEPEKTKPPPAPPRPVKQPKPPPVEKPLAKLKLPPPTFKFD